MPTSSTSLLFAATPPRRAALLARLGLLALVGAATPPHARAQVATPSWTLEAPGGAYTIQLTASGKGCPPSTWQPTLSADGAALTVTFTQLYVGVSPSKISEDSECAFEARLRAPAGRSYAVRRFGYFGRADLDPGVTGKQTASYVLQDAPSPPPNQSILSGPLNGPYSSLRELGADELAWSPCSADEPLRFVTQLSLRAGEPPGYGIVDLSHADAADTRLVVELSSRACSLTPAGALKPTQLRLSPATVNPSQPFTVSWTPVRDRADASYSVEVAQAGAPPGQLVWQSALTPGSSLVYGGPVLSPTLGGGIYTVVVSAYLDARIYRSDPATLRVLPAPVTTPPTTPADPVGGPTSPQAPASSNPSDPSPSVPAWATPLIGTYAVGTETFATSVLGTMVRAREVLLAQIAQVGGQLELRTQLCAKETSSLGSALTLRNPDAYPEVRQRIVLDNQSWRTIGTPLAIAFDRDGYVGCNGSEGQRVPKRPEQTWIVGPTCQCPATQTEPPTADDCRVGDPDRDGHPGIAYPWSDGIGAAQGWVSHVAATNRGFYVDGTVDPGGAHSASIHADEVTFALACEPGTCGVSVDTRPCTAEYNRASFRRLGPPPSGGWTCSLLRQRQSALVPPGSGRAPSRCNRDIVNPTP